MRIAWVAIFLGVLIWSGIGPKDYPTWGLEVFPAVTGAVILWFTRERFPLTTLVYVLILAHCIILMIGGHYTYAEVPLGEWMRLVFDESRNDYDKIGHFEQGFVPAIVARELMIRLRVFNSARWRNFFIVCLCLAISAFYELIEWWAALLVGDWALAQLWLFWIAPLAGAAIAGLDVPAARWSGVRPMRSFASTVASGESPESGAVVIKDEGAVKTMTISAEECWMAPNSNSHYAAERREPSLTKVCYRTSFARTICRLLPRAGSSAAGRICSKTVLNQCTRNWPERKFLRSTRRSSSTPPMPARCASRNCATSALRKR